MDTLTIVTNVMARCDPSQWLSEQVISALVSCYTSDDYCQALEDLVTMGCAETMVDSGTTFWRLT